MSSPPIPDESLGFLLTDATRAIRRRFEQRATELGLSSAQWRVLVHLLRRGPLSQARLAEFLEIEPISVSRLVDRMQEAGWVEREPDPNDRRVKLVVAKRKAHAAFENARQIADDLYEQALAGLPPGALDTLTDALRRIIINLSDSPEAQDDR
ncbi:MarR family transcriptional regulator [Rhodobacter sp. 140A]|nr:MarR family transcriptional regulator [Rhodobacter sp. 140A]